MFTFFAVAPETDRASRSILSSNNCSYYYKPERLIHTEKVPSADQYLSSNAEINPQHKRKPFIDLHQWAEKRSLNDYPRGVRTIHAFNDAQTWFLFRLQSFHQQGQCG
ncbi:hypothetical protein OAL60_01075 [bacterium]|nr:hypothetical protein [bacterium]